MSLPSLLILQGTKDDNVTPEMAPRFAAAFSSRRSKFTNAAVKVSTTTGMDRHAWARITPGMLCTRPSDPK